MAASSTQRKQAQTPPLKGTTGKRAPKQQAGEASASVQSHMLHTCLGDNLCSKYSIQFM